MYIYIYICTYVIYARDAITHRYNRVQLLPDLKTQH